MKKILLLALSAILVTATFAQHKTENIIIVTLDGMRWQEVFGGADAAIIANKKFTRDSEEVVKKFWADDVNDRRKKLFPFFWNTIASHGQLYGNHNKSSNVNVANPYWFSYPGYNEIFTGYPDTAVNSNDHILNKNENVLEFINKQKSYTGKIAAFSTWDCFPYILNEQRSGIYVNSDVDTLKFNDASLKLIDDMQFLTPKPSGARPDVFTFFAAREYLKTYKPKVLYVAFDETDHFAHAGEYDVYLETAHAEDGMIANLWNTVQSIPEYKDKTTLIVCCDHGRGDKIKEQWTSHGQDIQGADQIWIAAMGPDTAPLGELSNSPQLYQKQFAATIAKLLGLDFSPAHPAGEPVKTIFSK